MKRSLKDIREKKLYQKFLKETFFGLKFMERKKVANMVGVRANWKESDYKTNNREDQHLKDFLREAEEEDR